MSIRQEAHRHENHLRLLETEARDVGGILSRNCSEIDWTFEYGPPFLHMSLPMCGDVIRPNMILKRENLTCELDPAFLPNNQTRDCVAELMAGGSVTKLVIVIHGFLKSLSSSVWMLQLSSLLTADPDTAVLLVGWGHGSGGSPFPGGTKILQFVSILLSTPLFRPLLLLPSGCQHQVHGRGRGEDGEQ